MLIESWRFYEQQADDYCERTEELDLSHLYAPFLKRLPQTARILDAGCGSGRDSKAFSELGYEVEAIDASPAMVARAKELVGVPVRCVAFEDFEPNTNLYDGIWACASLLHVPRTNLPNVLQRLAQSLRPGGVFYASFKLGCEQRMKGGRLFVDLDEDALQEIVDGVPELTIETTWRTNDSRPSRQDEQWLNCLLLRHVSPASREPTDGASRT